MSALNPISLREHRGPLCLKQRTHANSQTHNQPGVYSDLTAPFPQTCRQTLHRSAAPLTGGQMWEKAGLYAGPETLRLAGVSRVSPALNYRFLPEQRCKETSPRDTVFILLFNCVWVLLPQPEFKTNG